MLLAMPGDESPDDESASAQPLADKAASEEQEAGPAASEQPAVPRRRRSRNRQTDEEPLAASEQPAAAPRRRRPTNRQTDEEPLHPLVDRVRKRMLAQKSSLSQLAQALGRSPGGVSRGLRRLAWVKQHLVEIATIFNTNVEELTSGLTVTDAPPSTAPVLQDQELPGGYSLVRLRSDCVHLFHRGHSALLAPLKLRPDPGQIVAWREGEQGWVTRCFAKDQTGRFVILRHPDVRYRDIVWDTAEAGILRVVLMIGEEGPASVQPA